LPKDFDSVHPYDEGKASTGYAEPGNPLADTMAVQLRDDMPTVAEARI
jgi:hypothetical protein